MSLDNIHVSAAEPSMSVEELSLVEIDVIVNDEVVNIIETSATELVLTPDIYNTIADLVNQAISENPSTGVTNQVLQDAITTHVIDPEPHPVYDNAHSFELIFKNGLL